jgi:hypothetical protein
MTQSSYIDRTNKIKEIEERIKFIEAKDNRFIGANVWMNELEELEKAIKEGLQTSWFADKNIEYVSGENIGENSDVAVIVPKKSKGKKSKR